MGAEEAAGRGVGSTRRKPPDRRAIQPPPTPTEGHPSGCASGRRGRAPPQARQQPRSTRIVTRRPQLPEALLRLGAVFLWYRWMGLPLRRFMFQTPAPRGGVPLPQVKNAKRTVLNMVSNPCASGPCSSGIVDV